MVIVTSIALWPTICWTTCGGAPSASRRLTQVCRMSWKRGGGSPSTLRTTYQLRLRLSGSIGVPTVDAGVVGITRFAPQVARAEQVLGIELTLLTSPPL